MDKFLNTLAMIIVYGIVACGLFIVQMMLTGCTINKPINGSNTVKVERSIPEECIDENGQFNEDLGTDTLDCGNLPR